MSPQEIAFLKRIDPEGKKYICSNLEWIDPLLKTRDFRVYPIDAENYSMCDIFSEDSMGVITSRPLTDSDVQRSANLFSLEWEHLEDAYASLGYKYVEDDGSLPVCKITDASVHFYWEPDVPSPYGEGHFITMSLEESLPWHLTTEEELQEVGAYFRELRDKAVEFAKSFECTARLAHISLEPYFYLVDKDQRRLPDVFIGFTASNEPELVHKDEIDEIIFIDALDSIENYLLFAIYRLIA